MFEFWIIRDTSGIFLSPTVRVNYVVYPARKLTGTGCSR
jgi:hypothetical protein